MSHKNKNVNENQIKPSQFFFPCLTGTKNTQFLILFAFINTFWPEHQFFPDESLQIFAIRVYYFFRVFRWFSSCLADHFYELHHKMLFSMAPCSLIVYKQNAQLTASQMMAK